MKRLTILLMLVTCVILVAAPAMAESVLDKVKTRGKLIVGVKDTVPPFGFVDEKTGQLVGFECDLVAAIGKKLGVPVEFKPVTSQTRIPTLKEGNVDLLAATMTHTKTRDDEIDFTQTYFYDEQKLLVKKGSPVKSYKDLAGKKVGSAKGSTSEQNIIKVQPKCVVVSFENYPEAFLALKQGKVEAVTTDSGILLGLKASDEKPDAWEVVGADFIAAEPYAMGVVENDSKWRDFINVVLIELQNSGEYEKLWTKWFSGRFSLALGKPIDTWPLR
jgi:polar amino acid transport system substrate-binding protein